MILACCVPSIVDMGGEMGDRGAMEDKGGEGDENGNGDEEWVSEYVGGYNWDNGVNCDLWGVWVQKSGRSGNC